MSGAMSPFSIKNFFQLLGPALYFCAHAEKAAGQCYYRWVEIPGIQGWSPYAEAINNLGQVTGNLRNLGDYARGFVWSPENGTQMLPMPPGIVDLQSYDINDLGHIVGMASSTTGTRPFLWDGCSYTIIEIPAWANRSEAYGINNQDQVVGMVQNTGGSTHAFIWETGIFTDLGPLIGPVESFATKINDQGQILGWWGSFGVLARAFIINGKEFETLPISDPFIVSRPGGINNHGLPVGSGQTGGDVFTQSGLIWTKVRTEILPPWAGARFLELAAVNDAHRAVGVLAGPIPRLPILAQNGVAQDLRPLVETQRALDLALDINRFGQILTIARSPLGSLVLTPEWLAGDLTGDCHVTFEDLTLMLVDFGAPSGSYPRSDIDLDGDIDLDDLSILLAHWGE